MTDDVKAMADRFQEMKFRPELFGVDDRIVGPLLTMAERDFVVAVLLAQAQGSGTEEQPFREARPSVPSDGFDCFWLYENGREVGSLTGSQNDPDVIARAQWWEHGKR